MRNLNFKLKLKLYCSTTGIYLSELVPEEIAYDMLLEQELNHPRMDFEVHDHYGNPIDYEN